MPGLGQGLPNCPVDTKVQFETEQGLWEQYGCRHWVAEFRREGVERLEYI